MISEKTGYKVGHYCGEMGQDFWDARKWLREFESKQVKFPSLEIKLEIRFVLAYDGFCYSFFSLSIHGS